MLKTNRNLTIWTGSFESKQPSPFSHQYSRPVGVEPALKCRLGAGEGQLQDLNGHQGLEGKVPSLCEPQLMFSILAPSHYSSTLSKWLSNLLLLMHIFIIAFYHQVLLWVHTVSNTIIESVSIMYFMTSKRLSVQREKKVEAYKNCKMLMILFCCFQIKQMRYNVLLLMYVSHQEKLGVVSNPSHNSLHDYDSSGSS